MSESIQTPDLGRSLQSARLEVPGHGYTLETTTERNVGALALLGLSGAFFWWIFRHGAVFDSGHENSMPGIVAFLAFLMLIIGFVLPSTQYKFINLQQRRIVEEKWYFFVKYSRRETPLSDFSRIVVHHVCHSGEGEDTFTGSVGFKPIESGSIFWVKEFPATKDEMPFQPDIFAKELAILTGLPYFGSATTAGREETMTAVSNGLVER